MPKKHRLGFMIPFTKKWSVNRKLKALEREADKITGMSCDLSKRIEKAKKEAGTVFVKDEYDSRIKELEDSIRRGQRCLATAGKAPLEEPGEKLGKACERFVLDKYGWKGFQKREQKKDPRVVKAKDFVKDCIEGGGPDAIRVEITRHVEKESKGESATGGGIS